MQERKVRCILNSVTPVKIILLGGKGLEMGLNSKTVFIGILSTYL